MTDNPIFAGSRHRIRRWRNYGMSMGFGAGIKFFFRDDFLTDEGAPLTSPRTAEPGPGTATIVDTGNKVSITSGNMQRSTVAVTAWEDPRYYTDVQTRASGLGLYFKFTPAANHKDIIGWRSVVAGGFVSIESGILFDNAPVLDVATFQGNGLISNPIGSLVANIEVGCFVILGSTGYKIVIDNQLLWVSQDDSTASLYGSWQFGTGAIVTTKVGDFRISQLPSPWDTDYGIATDRLAGARTPVDPFTHEADFLGEFIQTTVPTAGFTSFQFRRQDATNYWEVIIEPSQDLTLREVVAGVPTARGVAVGVVNNGDRIVAIADGPTIRVYEQNTLRITYALAANFQTETDGSLLALGVGGAVSDIVTWPRVISAAALRALDRVADA